MSLPFPVSVTDAAASAVFQIMLTVCHRKRPKLCKQLLKRIMEYLTSRSAAPGVRSEMTLVLFFLLSKNESLCCEMLCNRWFCFCIPLSPLLVFLKDQASSRLIETMIQLSNKSLLRDLYKNHLKGQLVDLALHPIANFPVQRLTAATAKYKLVGHDVCMSHGAGLKKDSVIARVYLFSLSLSLRSS